MAKKKNWIPYSHASQIAREAGCKSRKQFMDWHKETGVKDIPKQPNRVYAEWDGWPAFLETGNVFAADKDSQAHNYRTYWEAVRWAQNYCIENDITTGQGWKHAYRADEEQGIFAIPKDIPKHPENYYSEDWTGWPAWLGKNVKEKLIAAKQQIAVFCLAIAPWRPANIITTIVAPDGEAQLLDLLHQKGMKPARIYKFDKSVGSEIEQALRQSGSQQSDGSWICRNVHQLRSDIDYLLEVYTVEDQESLRRLTVRSPAPNDGFEAEDKTHVQQVDNSPSSFI